MKSKKFLLIFLIVFGCILLFKPELLIYINWEYINFNAFLTDYKFLQKPIGISLILFPILIFLFLYIKSNNAIIMIISKNYQSVLPPLYFYNIIYKKIFDKQIESVEGISNGLRLLNNSVAHIEELKINKFTLYAILSVPLLVKLGYLLNDSIFNISYMHYFRNKCKIKQLSNSFLYKKHSLINKYIINNIKPSSELLLIIQISYRVNTDFYNPVLNNIDRLVFECDKIGVDVINNINDLNNMFNLVFNKLREIEDTYSRINVILAVPTSSAILFGQKISNTIDKPIRVFHYDNKQKNNRPWSILINTNNIDYSKDISIY